MSTQSETVRDKNNGTVVAQGSPGSRHARTHQKYWEPRLKKRAYINDQGQRITIPEWQIRLQHLGRREWFNTHTANRGAAAIIARDIFVSLVASGWEATLSKFKPDPLVKTEICSVGEFLEAVRTHGQDKVRKQHFKARTFAIYSGKFRSLVAGVAKVDSKLSKKSKRRKYDYFRGGRAEWVKKVDGCSMAILTKESITAWHTAYPAYEPDIHREKAPV